MAYQFLLTFLLAGCWHEAFRTSVDNDTGQRIYAVIHFDDQKVPPGHGYIEPGNGVSLPQMPTEISYIEYGIGNVRCRMDKGAIAKAMRSEENGVVNIRLGGCDALPPAAG